jgi:hypothetical protein
MATKSSGLYNELRSKIGRGLELPAIGKNLFINMAEKTSRELNVSNCWICEDALMSEEWPWKGFSLNAYQLLLWNHSITIKDSDCTQSWILTPEVIRKECLEKTGLTYDKWVGETSCKWILSYNGTNLTWQPEKPTWYWASSSPNDGSQCYKSLTNHSLLSCSPTNEANPFRGIPEICKYWDHLTSTAPGWWKMPDGLFWICGNWADSRLPPTSSCTIGIFQTRFFILPNSQEQLGVPLFETLGTRTKRKSEV